MAAEKQNKLEISLDPRGGVPFYRQIILQIEMAIADGRVKPGVQLPTVRGLAVDLQINPNTVARAYSELEIRGIVNTQQGTGTFISDRKPTIGDSERQDVLERVVQGLLAEAARYGFTIDEVISHLQGKKEHR
jgi:GntR family transcriptional regulator